MHLKYLHYFGNESSESILEAYGIVTTDEKIINKSKPKQCPNCLEPNKPDSKFCVKCRMILSYDAYCETVEEKKQKDCELLNLQTRHEKEMKEIREEMRTHYAQIISLIQDNPKLSLIKPEVLSNMK